MVTTETRKRRSRIWRHRRFKWWSILQGHVPALGYSPGGCNTYLLVLYWCCLRGENSEMIQSVISNTQQPGREVTPGRPRAHGPSYRPLYGPWPPCTGSREHLRAHLRARLRAHGPTGLRATGSNGPTGPRAYGTLRHGLYGPKGLRAWPLRAWPLRVHGLYGPTGLAHEPTGMTGMTGLEAYLVIDGRSPRREGSYRTLQTVLAPVQEQW